MKISIIGSRGYPYVYSGYETFVKELSERLVKKNLDITIYCHRYLFEKRVKKVNNINLIYIPTIKSKYLSQLVHSFLSIIHCVFKQPDIILVLNVANGPLGLLPKIFGIPTLINVDGLEWLRPKWKGLGSIYFRFAAKAATLFYDKIINDSVEMQKIYLDQYNIDSVVIAYGAPKINIKTSSGNQFGLSPMNYYLVVGRLIPDNNADIIIEGFIRSSSNKKLVIVGDVPYKDKYASEIKKCKDSRVIFTGYVTDPNLLYKLYRDSYVYIHGHEYGGTNPTMIKAMAYGSAILALNTVFNREMLSFEKFGFYFEKNPESIRESIEFAETNEKKIKLLKINSIKGITKKYDWDYISEQYISVFKSLLLKT